MLTLQTIQLVPNGVYVPQVVIQQGINNGKLIVSCQITLAAAKVVNIGTPTEQWVPTGQTEMFYISDLLNLDSDIIQYQTQVNTWLNNLNSLVELINAKRKVLWQR